MLEANDTRFLISLEQLEQFEFAGVHWVRFRLMQLQPDEQL